MRTAYLSIDLDYGNTNISQLLAILKFAKSLNVQTILVDSHDELFDHFKFQNMEFDTLINVDEHSDLYSWTILDTYLCSGRTRYARGVHCGNWVNFTKYFAKHYLWIRPTIGEGGRCDYDKCAFHKIPTDYKTLRTIHSGWRKTLNKFDIIGVGIAMSLKDRYTDPQTVSALLKDASIFNWFEELNPDCTEYMSKAYELDNFLEDDDLVLTGLR